MSTVKQDERRNVCKTVRVNLTILGDFDSRTGLAQPIADSQLNSNQWKSLIIPTACDAVELISVPVVRHTMQNYKAVIRGPALPAT